MLNFLLAFIPRAIVQGIPLLFGSTGEIVTEKSGNLNLGIPGVMYVGAICGVIGSFFYEHSVPDASAMNGTLAILIPMACCMLGSLLMGILYCFLTVTLRANQNVTGLAMTAAARLLTEKNSPEWNKRQYDVFLAGEGEKND